MHQAQFDNYKVEFFTNSSSIQYLFGDSKANGGVTFSEQAVHVVEVHMVLNRQFS